MLLSLLLSAASSASIILYSADALSLSSSLQHRRHSVLLPLESVPINAARRGAAMMYASSNNIDTNNEGNLDEEKGDANDDSPSNNDNSYILVEEEGDIIDDDSYISKRYPNPQQTSWAYSGLTNVWGYSARLVTKRERRRYERRRIRHRRKVEAKSYSDGDNYSGSGNTGKRRLNWVSRMVEDDIVTGAGDAFVGNVMKKNSADADNNDVNTNFDDDEMDEDGYWNMLGKKKRSTLKRLLRIPYRALFGEYRTVEPGTLILVRHGESEWNANKTFTGWANPDLSPQGYREVEHAARLLLEGGYKVDVVFTSRLKRAIRSAWILIREMNEVRQLCIG